MLAVGAVASVMALLLILNVSLSQVQTDQALSIRKRVVQVGTNDSVPNNIVDPGMAIIADIFVLHGKR